MKTPLPPEPARSDDGTKPEVAAAKTSSVRAWLAGVVIVFIIVAAAVIGYLLSRDDLEDLSPATELGASPSLGQSIGRTLGFGGPPAPPPPPPGLRDGTDYYLMVRTLEARPAPDDREHWDRLDHSGPDLYYELHWQGNKLFTSPVRANALVATWDLLSIDLRELVGNAGEVDVESIINAPVIAYTAGGPDPEIRIFDNDPPFGDDRLGTITLPLGDAVPGVNTLFPEPSAEADDDTDGGVTRVSYVLIDRHIPLPDLIALVSNR